MTVQPSDQRPPQWGEPGFQGPPRRKLTAKQWIIVAAAIFGLGLFIYTSAHDTTTPAEPAGSAVATTQLTVDSEHAALVAYADQAAPLLDDFSADSRRMADLFDPDALLNDPTGGLAQLDTLTADVQAMRALGPVPVAEIDLHWQRSLDAYEAAYEEYRIGILATDTDALDRGTTRSNLGSREMDRMTELLNEYQQ